MQKITIFFQLLFLTAFALFISSTDFSFWDTVKSSDFLNISLKKGASHTTPPRPTFQPSNNTYDDFSDFAGKDHQRNPEQKDPVKDIHHPPPSNDPKNPKPQDSNKDPNNTGKNENNSKNTTTKHDQPSQSVAGDSDDSIKWIFKSSPQGGNYSCLQRDNRPHFLCKLSLRNKCISQYLVEVLDTFWIICPIYTANQKQTERLYDLHRNFRSYIQSYGINFQTVETIFPGQEFQLTKPNNEPYDLQYKDEWIFAMRENLVNVGIKHLPEDWQFVSWIDQHIFWLDPYWFEKSIHLMSHHNIVHLLNGNDFKNMTNGTDYSLRGVIKYYYDIGINYWRYVPQQWGLAWATNKETFSKLGGLLDICIGTKCDFYQAVTYTGIMFDKMTDNNDFNDDIRKWQEHAIKVYDGKVGFLDSKVYHFIHCMDGCRTSQYDQQIGLLYQNKYNPHTDLTRDKEGRLSLTNNTALAQGMWRLYGGGPRS